MTNLTHKLIQQTQNLIIAVLLATSGSSIAASLAPVVDDFSDANDNKLGIARQFMNDSMAGGKTTTQLEVVDGVLHLQGQLVPPRGQPGWASAVLLLDPQGLPQDASAFSGIRLIVKVTSGSLSVSANSTEVHNFDYHAAPVVIAADNKFHEVKIPFSSMRRAWSEQTELNTTTLSGLSIVAFSLQAAAFDYELDEVGFY